jgi:RNA polymerase sigma-70 factor (sigma-E family)
MPFGRSPVASERDKRIASLFDAHYGCLRGLAYVLLGDHSTAEEIVMDVFLKAFSGWGQFRSVEQASPYLRKMVVNACRSVLRRRSIEEQANALLGAASDADPNADRHEESMDLWSAVAQLPERQRTCVVLRYLEDLSEPQIAEVMDCSVGTVKSQLSRGRQKLQRSLGSAASRGEA